MKHFPAFCIVLQMSWFVFMAPSATASEGGGSKHISTGKILEFSLSHLKESSQKTKKKNEEIAAENAAFRERIRNLQKVQGAIAVQKGELAAESISFNHRQKQMNNIIPFDGKKRRQRVDELISIFERDIRKLKEEIRILDDQYDEKRFDSQRRVLLKNRDKNRKNLLKAEKNLKILEKKRSGARFKDIEILRNEKKALKREVRLLEDKL